MITLVNFAAAVLMLLLLVPAAARLTRLVSRDDITSPLRGWIYHKFGEESFLGRMIQCHWCAGVWVSGFVSIPTWIIIWDLVPEWQATTKIWLWLLTVLGVAYEASRKIDREGM